MPLRWSRPRQASSSSAAPSDRHGWGSGGVAPKPGRARAAEAQLVGSTAGPGAFSRAAQAALADAKPSGDNAFKIELAQRLIVRALTSAAQGTPARMPARPASPFSSAVGALHV